MSDKQWEMDSDMLMQLHNTARVMEQNDKEAGPELRRIADRFSTSDLRKRVCND